VDEESQMSLAHIDINRTVLPNKPSGTVFYAGAIFSYPASEYNQTLGKFDEQLTVRTRLGNARLAVDLPIERCDIQSMDNDKEILVMYRVPYRVE